ncbi:restriction endonuclease subunit S [Methanobrevibacter sp.]|uniref:restriction endonuclease subunit S n=1 Tax=Methanobrevibacter sp. TaxID=66852 RepID=UPI0025EAAA49|nr:restriction endonuclease subunit S [Methanobrevibacter sp.]MBQ2665240.1 restriction endonuclease subunit S [Methanobrevibacter sp.]
MQKIILNDIAEVISGLSYRRYLDDDGEKFKVIVQRSIKRDGILSDFEDVKLNDNFKDRYFTKKNDVLMKMTYPYDVVCVKQENLIISDRIAIIRLEKGYDPEFIAHLLTNTHIEKQLHELGGSGKLPHTSLKEIKQLQLTIPDLETQTKYGELLNTINEKIFEDQRQVEYDRHLKEAILNDLWGDSP